MCSRMAIYLTQVYMPFFFLNTLHLSRVNNSFMEVVVVVLLFVCLFV